MTDLTGQYLGRYYLSERLGEGGMAVVYKAYDTRLERDVAVKIIRSGAFPADALGEVLKRFEREAKSLAKLSHSNIVKVYDYGEHDGEPYLVMEYLPGGTLKENLGRPIPWQEAVRLILPVARGVAYAHQRGVLHRDIKPANILITDGGEPMLSDFGIAKLFEGNQTTALTGSGMAVGTPEYMAPEQWTGTTSLQSDLYSLGIVLYEMVTGRKPYVADTPAAILIKQATEPLPSPRKFAMELPEALELVLIKVLAREPEDRYPDINAFMGALENLSVGPPVSPPLERSPVKDTHKASSPASSFVSKPTQMPVPSSDETEKVSAALETQKVEGQEQISQAGTARSLKFSRKRVTGLFFGGIVILFAVLLGLPRFGKWFSPAPLSTTIATYTATKEKTLTSTLGSSSLTPSLTEMPTNAPVSTPTQSDETLLSIPLGEWTFWVDPWCSHHTASYQYFEIYVVNIKENGTFTRGKITRLYTDGHSELTDNGEAQGQWTVVGDEVTLVISTISKHVAKLDENSMKQGRVHSFRNGEWVIRPRCWSAVFK